jgi:hypothetical protein
MKISDIFCPACGAAYEMAEALTIDGPAGRETCAVCGQTLASWDDHRLKAFRLVVAPESKYATVPVSPVAGAPHGRFSS